MNGPAAGGVRVARVVLLALLAVLSSGLLTGCLVQETSEAATVDPETGLAWIAESDLPPEAVDTLGLIDAGGPFPYPDKDGSTFGNFEGLLPEADRGYYAEYTVETPGLGHRGARRIVTGDGGEYYWTEDHYQSFERIAR